MPNKVRIRRQKISPELLARAKAMQREMTHTMLYAITACQVKDPNVFIGKETRPTAGIGDNGNPIIVGLKPLRQTKWCADTFTLRIQCRQALRTLRLTPKMAFSFELRSPRSVAERITFELIATSFQL
jgi:hypothetical protein